MLQFEEMLRKLKPAISEADQFQRYHIEDVESPEEHKDKPKHWKTILNNQLAALKMCTEIVAEMKKMGLKKWSDYEFGPRDGDPFGATALYFYDNDIPPGCPDPEEVKWLRPEEILETLIENGESHYKNKKPIFIDYEDTHKTEAAIMAQNQSGASSNDVKQSKYLGDCWFISALSLIASDDTKLRG